MDINNGNFETLIYEFLKSYQYDYFPETHLIGSGVDSLTGTSKTFDSSKETKQNMPVYLPLFLPAMKGYVQKELAFDARLLVEYLEEIKQLLGE